MPWLPPLAGVQRPGHPALDVRVQPEQVLDLVHQHAEQVPALLLPLVAGGGELTVVPGRCIDEPAPAGGIVIEPDRPGGG
jgi:hypothetical protein